MRSSDEWGLVVEGDEGHVVVIAVSGGRLGCAYAGQITSTGLAWQAWPSRDLVRVGVVDPTPLVCSSREEAQRKLADHAQRLARKLVFADQLKNKPIA